MKPKSILISGFSYFPPQMGRIDIYQYSKHIDKKYNILILSGKKNKEINEENFFNNKVKIFRYPFKTEKQNILSIIEFVKYNLLFILKNRKDIDVYHLINPFILSPIIFIMIRLFNFMGLTRIKILYDIRTGPLNEGFKFIYSKFIIWLSIILSDKVIILYLPLGENLFGNKYNFSEVPLGFEEMKKNNFNITEFRKSLGIKNSDIALIYIGTTDYRRRIDKMIESFKLSYKKNNRLKLIIVGKIENYLDKYRSEKNILFIGEVPYSDITKYLNISNIGLSWIPQVDYYMLQPPLKALEYLGNGIPVVATKTNGNLHFIKDGLNGYLSNGEVEDFAQGILLMTKKYKKLKSNTKKSVEKYKWNKIVTKSLLPIYNELFNKLK